MISFLTLTLIKFHIKQDVVIFSTTFDKKISDGFCEITLSNRISLNDIFGEGKPLLVTSGDTLFL